MIIKEMIGRNVLGVQLKRYYSNQNYYLKHNNNFYKEIIIPFQLEIEIEETDIPIEKEEASQ